MQLGGERDIDPFRAKDRAARLFKEAGAGATRRNRKLGLVGRRAKAKLAQKVLGITLQSEDVRGVSHADFGWGRHHRSSWALLQFGRRHGRGVAYLLEHKGLTGTRLKIRVACSAREHT
jgi:hypothetical protein